MTLNIFFHKTLLENVKRIDLIENNDPESIAKLFQKTPPKAFFDNLFFSFST